MIAWIENKPGVQHKLKQLGFENSGLWWNFFGLKIVPEQETLFSDIMPKKKGRVWITIQDLDQLLFMLHLGIPITESLPELLKDKTT